MKTIRNPSTRSGQAPSTSSGLGKRGVTLIEVVAALGIIAIGIVGLLTLFPLGLEASARAGDRTTAAIIGEYVIEQVRLRQQDIKDTDTSTSDALDALGWDGHTGYTFDAGGSGDFGSGELFVKQDVDDLTDEELYSRYEVTLKFENVSGFASGGLKRVIVTVRWPRAFSDEARKKQDTMTFVTYIRPGA